MLYCRGVGRYIFRSSLKKDTTNSPLCGFAKLQFLWGFFHRHQNLCHLNPCMRLNLGVFGFFPFTIKIIVVRQVRVLPACTAGMSVKTNKCKMLHGTRRSWMHLFCVCIFSIKNLKTLKLSSMADDVITGGGIGSLVSLVYIRGIFFIFKTPRWTNQHLRP